MRPTLARHDISATQDPLLQLFQNDVCLFCSLKIGQTMNETGVILHSFSPACLRVGFLKRIQMFGSLELPSYTHVPPSLGVECARVLHDAPTHKNPFIEAFSYIYLSFIKLQKWQTQFKNNWNKETQITHMLGCVWSHNFMVLFKTINGQLEKVITALTVRWHT